MLSAKVVSHHGAVSQAGGAAWTYDPVRKHAVTQAGSSAYAYTYDANGNMATRSGNLIGWTSYNYPSSIAATGESVSFQYGPDRQRWQTIYMNSSGTETTYHVGKLLEKVATGSGTDYRHYIFAGNELVAIASRMSSGTNTVHYMLGDHQSSVASIITSAGALDVSESFSAYGNRRSGETWAGAPSTQDETAINGVSRVGYTGQTALGISMGLNHMNGRVEDAIIGRFLSPDPYVPDPANTQSLNRYSYVNNNPLTFIDPSGFDDCPSPSGGHPSGDAPGPAECLDPITVQCTINCGPDHIVAPTPGLIQVTTPSSASPGGGAGGGSASSTTSQDTLTQIVVTAQRPKQPDPRCTQPLRGNTTVTQNINFLRQLSYMSNGNAAPFLAWLMNVAPGGAWDYKNGAPTQNNDMMGNFNFGATGNQFFSPTTILSGAGVVQLLTNPSGSDGGVPFLIPPYGDDVQGQAQTMQGINGGC